MTFLWYRDFLQNLLYIFNKGIFLIFPLIISNKLHRPININMKMREATGVALAMRHRLNGSPIIIHWLAQWPGKGRWAPRLRSIRSTTTSLPFLHEATKIIWCLYLTNVDKVLMCCRPLWRYSWIRIIRTFYPSVVFPKPILTKNIKFHSVWAICYHYTRQTERLKQYYENITPIECVINKSSQHVHKWKKILR